LVTQATPEPEATPEPRWIVRHWPKLLFSLLMAGGFVWLLRQGGLPLLPPAQALDQVAWWGVALHVLIWSSALLIRATRWHFLLAVVQRVPMRTVLRTTLVGYVAIVLMPFRTGEVLRPLLIQRDGKISAWAATGTIGAERIVDGLVVSGLLLVSLFFARPIEPLHDVAKFVPGAAYVFAAVFLLAFLLMSLFYWQRRWARRMSEAVIGVISLKLARWISGRLEQVADGLGFLKNARYALPFLAITLVYWGLSGVSWWVLGRAAGLSELSVQQAFVAMGVLAIGITIPNTPGFFGQFQAAIYAGLGLYFTEEQIGSAGAVYVFLTYVNQLGITFALGALAAATRPRA
jgi:glycosyltransferase 2 family protein